jgi:hypothetical protein
MAIRATGVIESSLLTVAAVSEEANRAEAPTQGASSSGGAGGTGATENGGGGGWVGCTTASLQA